MWTLFVSPHKTGREYDGGSWNAEGRKAIGLAASLNSTFGLWPVDIDNFYLRLRWGIAAFSLIVMVLQAIYDSYLNCVGTENNIGNLFPVIFGIIGLSKMFFCYIHRDILRSNVESIVQDWKSEDSKNYNSIMFTCKSNYIRFTQFVIIYGGLTTTMFVFKAFFIDPDPIIEIKNDKDGQDGNITILLIPRFELPSACTFQNASGSLYWLIVVVQLFQTMVGFGVNLCPDGLFMTITTHLCSQFEILKIKFVNCLKGNNITETREKLSILVARHKHLLKLAKQLETAYSMIVFFLIVMNLFIVNVAGYNFLVVLKRREIVGMMTNALILQFALVQTFMYSYIGDKLTGQGEDIAQSVYESEWYSIPMNVSKDVMLVMTRTRYPIGLTAGSFFKISRSTFTDVVKTAASYLSVIRIMIKDDF